MVGVSDKQWIIQWLEKLQMHVLSIRIKLNLILKKVRIKS